MALPIVMCFFFWALTAAAKTVPGVPFEVDYVVAKDGSGDYETVQDAIEATPKNDFVEQSFVILVKPGVYQGQVLIPPDSKFITMVGYPGKTIFQNNLYAFSPNPDYDGPKVPHATPSDPLQGLSLNDTGRERPYLGTSNAATFIVKANGFIGVGLTFVNTFGPTSKERPYAMAPAFRAFGDFIQLHYCAFDGFQDTLYAHRGVQLYQNCYIAGSIDFIFGYARAWFDDCLISVKGPVGYPGSIVAQARQTADNYTGFVVKDSLITGYGKVNLGRAWRNYSTVLFANNHMDDVINPFGWNDFGFAYRQDTVSFFEFNNTGPGANRTGRANYSEEITYSRAKKYLDPGYINLGKWFRKPPPPLGTLPQMSLNFSSEAPGPSPFEAGSDLSPTIAPGPVMSTPLPRMVVRTEGFVSEHSSYGNTQAPPPSSSATALKRLSAAALLGLSLSVILL